MKRRLPPKWQICTRQLFLETTWCAANVDVSQRKVNIAMRTIAPAQQFKGYRFTKTRTACFLYQLSLASDFNHLWMFKFLQSKRRISNQISYNACLMKSWNPERMCIFLECKWIMPLWWTCRYFLHYLFMTFRWKCQSYRKLFGLLSSITSELRTYLPPFNHNNRDTGDLRRHPVHYDVTVMLALRWFIVD